MELKNGETYSGVLASCDGFMNLSLRLQKPSVEGASLRFPWFKGGNVFFWFNIASAGTSVGLLTSGGFFQ